MASLATLGRLRRPFLSVGRGLASVTGVMADGFVCDKASKARSGRPRLGRTVLVQVLDGFRIDRKDAIAGGLGHGCAAFLVERLAGLPHLVRPDALGRPFGKPRLPARGVGVNAAIAQLGREFFTIALQVFALGIMPALGVAVARGVGKVDVRAVGVGMHRHDISVPRELVFHQRPYRLFELFGIGPVRHGKGDRA